VPGAWVVLRKGLPLGFVDAGGRSLVTFSAARAGDLDQEGARALAAGLLRVAQEERRRSVRLSRIDGVPAASSDLAPRLLAAGFVAESGGLRLSS
jgi:hypothetical protein